MSHQDSSPHASVVDMALLGKLFEEHQPKLLAMVQRRLDPSLAARVSPDDILSDAFLEARRKWLAFKAQSALTPYAWLYGIVRDCLIQQTNRLPEHFRHPGVKRDHASQFSTAEIAIVGKEIFRWRLLDGSFLSG